MKEFSAMIDGAIATLSSAVATCCGWPEDDTSYYGKPPSRPVRIQLDLEPYPDFHPSSHTVPEKSFVPVYQQPSFTPPLSSKQPMKHRRGPSPTWEQAPGKRHDHVRTALSMKERFFSSSKSKPRRPQISGPTDFRHLTSGAPVPLDYEVTEDFETTRQPRHRQRSFRPLELNIHSNANGRLSSMLPYFGYASPPVTPPGRIMVQSSSSEDSITLKHQQSSSTMSFRIPRKPTPLGSVFDSPSTDMLPRPAPARLRAQASTEAPAAVMDDLIERVATAMKERDLLQEQIDDAIERQTLYVKSRPSTPVFNNANMEPMPQVPVLPPDAPSFSERISIDHPRTAPVRKPMVAPTPPPKSLSRDQPVHGLSLRRVITPPPKSAARPRAQGQLRQPQSLLSRQVGDQLPPPPLRKKKSFSRVSTWLGFPADVNDKAVFGSVRERSRDRSLPVLRQGGFYEVRSAPPRKSSFGSDDTVSDWTSDAEEEFDGQTLPTTCSPSSSGAATIRAVDHPVVLGQAPWRQSVVGVAF
ncbi:hypothetical protein PFICI_04840 [Pestalotiopsis fici W106-1]|uniref:Uncharacterized protein n=1 Tax=Pestalotiopsis fici (strain W106-1 / CGMCC3.15140) TaxID=1229662 RepID=W3XAB0_PESFW|nr:uncharacterized protein PFICI_04840 [Pestalotiopsis fici W106-1]ETS82964.1 hypothetical protein PFICI_04840 [Pestalotiopsis fici W106-1]